MKRVTTRLAATSAALAACGLILTGCGAGQISQTADQEAAVNGTSATFENIALRNVHLQALQTSDYLQPGRSVELMFVAANTSPDTDDKLLSITSDVGSVTLTGSAAVPASGALVVGSPDGQTEAMPMGSDQTGGRAPKGVVTLTKPITNGLNYGFTFEFDKAGKKTVEVPISAGNAPRDESSSGSH